MKIGLDFDNTLVSYDQLFHALACEQGLIVETVPQRKNAVRDDLRARGREPEWTALQGLAYGPRIGEAKPFPGLLRCLSHWEQQGHDCVLISHKTRYPYAGPAYDLHAAARQWIARHLQSQGLFQHSPLYFELSRAEKLQRIVQVAPDYYIDDLPDIVLDLMALAETHHLKLQTLLFDPHGQHPEHPASGRVVSWDQLTTALDI